MQTKVLILFYSLSGSTATGFGQAFQPPTEDDLTVARFLGRRVAGVAQQYFNKVG